MWYDGQKERSDTIYFDMRDELPGFTGQEGRTYSVEPDHMGDYRDLPYDNQSFKLVVFDPPHLTGNGMDDLSGRIRLSYGELDKETWKEDLTAGFMELWRVLEVGGTLVFKFADNDIYFSELFDCFPVDPLFGTTFKQRSGVETRYFTFFKSEACL